MGEIIKVFMNGISGEVADAVAGLPAVERVEDARTADVWLVNDAAGLDFAAAQGADQVILAVDRVDYLVDVYWRAPVSISSSDNDGVLAGALEAAARGGCYTSPSVAAIMRQLPTPEEQEALRAIFENPDTTRSQLAERLHVSEGGVRSRLRNLYTLGCVNSRAGLVVAALRRRWINPRDYGLGDTQPAGTLSERENRLLRMMFRWPDSSIVDLCRITGTPEGTLRTWMRSLFSHAGVHSREALLVEALRQGWVALGDVMGDRT